MLKAFLIFPAAVLSQPALAQAAPPQPAAACTTPEHSQFDFWLGYWEVYRTGTDRMVGRNQIEKLYDGCAIRESWTPLTGAGGSSLNTYRDDEKMWRQTWVDGSNSHADFRGGLVDGAMVIAGQWKGVNGPGTDGYVRITYSRQPDGSVRQFGEISSDGGKTFAPSFDLTYRPAKGGSAQSSR